MNNKHLARLCCAVAVPTAASLAFAAGEVEPVATTVSVDAVRTNNVEAVFRMEAFQADEIAQMPTHPPIDQIQPTPMPGDEVELPEGASTGPGNALFYDVDTRITTEVPMAFPNISGMAQGGGFVGADGFDSMDDMWGTRAFNTMTTIGDSSLDDWPWRGNVKLVQEYVDAGNGSSSFFVCSGAMQDAEVIMTAGHCVYNRDNDSTGSDFGFADRVWVYPGWDGNGLTLGDPGTLQYWGWARSSGFVAWTGYTNGGDFNSDLGFIRVSRAVGMLTGWFGWRSDGWGSCNTLGLSYNNASYPSEFCGGSLHNGRDMYYWFGTFSSCYQDNRFQLNTSGGCTDAVWGGMSGSNAYDIDGTSRFAHAVASTSNRSTYGRYVKLWTEAREYLNDTFKPDARGTALDIQSLQTRYAESVVTAGNQLTGGTAQVPNPTNNNPASDSYGLTMRLSTNNNISSSDTNLGSGSYTFNYAAMQNVNLNLFNATIPIGTPSGTYWVGTLLDNGIDANDSNNDPDLWDAHQITVNGVADPVANSCTAPSGTVYHNSTIGVGYNVTNQGGDPSNSVTIDIYASTNTNITTFDTLLGSFSLSTFNGQQTKSGTLNVQIPDTLLGTRYIGYIISASDDVNTGNNTAHDATPLNIDGRADLFANYMTALETTASLGGELDIRFNVQNNGTISSGAYDVDVYASTNTIISTLDTHLGTFSHTGLGVGGSSTIVDSVTIPSGMNPGDYYIGMIVEPGINENLTGDNDAFDPDTVAIVNCLPDFNNDGLLDLADILAFGSLFQNQDPAVDFDNNNLWDLSDIIAFIGLFQAGCP